MKKIFIFITIFISFLSFPKAIELPSEVNVSSESVIIYDLDKDEIVYEKNPDKQLSTASLAKIMTAYTVINNVKDLNKTITITDKELANLWEYTCAGLEVGEKYTYLELLYAMMLPSAADASQALALNTSGSFEKFNNLMNKEAKTLGLRRTKFVDSYGGGDENISTAREITKLTRIALQNETFKKIFTTTTKHISNDKEVTNYTRSIATYHGFNSDILLGNKSGFTQAAGLSLVSLVNINDTNYLIVSMKSNLNEYLTTHVIDTYKLIYFLQGKEFTTRTLLEKGTILKNIKVENSTTNEYQVTLEEDINVNLSIDEYDKVKLEYHIADKIDSTNKIGDNIGYIDILVNNQVISTYNVYLRDQIFKIEETPQKSIIIIVILIFFALAIFCTSIITSKKKN